MIRKSVIQKALDYYWLDLNVGISAEKQDEADEVKKCKKYLENGGLENRAWISENGRILYHACVFYHKKLDKDIKEAVSCNDEIQAAEFREERKEVLKYKQALEKFDV